MSDGSPPPASEKTLATALVSVRYGIPALLVLVGIACLIVVPSGTKFEAWALFTGAGLSVLLLNVLYRIGVQGDVERDREDAARSYFEERGEWPEEEEQPARRRWRLPESIATPESEAEEARASRRSG
jgi:hypothetical protein